jgi:hypothetical protein
MWTVPSASCHVSDLCDQRVWGARYSRYTVDFTKSHCPNLVCFNYKNAAESTKKSPCSNIPTICPLCPHTVQLSGSTGLKPIFNYVIDSLTLPTSHPL